MHSRDRRWPIVFLGLIVLIPIAVLLFILPESLVTFVEQINWSSPQTYSNLLAFIGLTALWITIIVASIRAQQREQRRARALAGDYAAMPLASDVLELPPFASTDHATRKPLTLYWADDSIITATAEGLLWQRPKKRDVFIQWHEARLFEVWEGGVIREDEKDKTQKAEIFQYGYCLYASMRRYIEWTDAPSGSVVDEQLSWEQKTHLQQELLAYISARTQLSLRVARQVPAKETSWWKILSLTQSLTLMLILAGIPITTAILALTAPMTNTLALNLYVAVLCGGVGLAFIFIPLWSLTHPSGPNPQPPSIVLPAVPASSGPVTIRFSRSWRDRLVGALLFTFALISSAYIIVRSIADFPYVWTSHTSGLEPHLTVTVLFFLYAFLGTLFIAATTFDRAAQWRIDIEGLHWGRGTKRESIPWVDVAILTAKFGKSLNVVSFTVTEAPPKSRTVTWPVKARWVQPPEGASPDDMGAHFAAIVAQRAGVQPTTQWE